MAPGEGRSEDGEAPAQNESASYGANWTITAPGTAVYWPDIDEEVSLAGMLGVSESALEDAAGFETIELDSLEE